MNLKKLFFTENLCYKRNAEKADGRYEAFQENGPGGIMLHSTAANNPWLKRYVGPDDGILGENKYGNHWNQTMSRQVCVHAFIGKLADGSVATYQTLPWNFRGWHCGGTGNNTHVGIEICEDNLKDATYFKKVYQEAIGLCVYLCRMYNLTENDIIDHSEGHKAGTASNHSDVGYWFKKHGKSMDTLRADVRKQLGRKPVTITVYQLQKGDSGEQVKALQHMLYARNYPIGNKNPFDGNFGPMVDKAVRKFQKDMKLPVTGIVDGATWKAFMGE